jgi:hypothetical protein
MRLRSCDASGTAPDHEIDGANVNVLGLIHGARDLAALWGKEDRPEPGAG